MVISKLVFETRSKENGTDGRTGRTTATGHPSVRRSDWSLELDERWKKEEERDKLGRRGGSGSVIHAGMDDPSLGPDIHA